MIYSFDGYNYVIRCDRGEHLAEVLTQFVAKTRLEGGWVSGLGAAMQVDVGFYDLDKKVYKWQTLTGLREVVSLTGNIAFNDDGTPAFHLHGVFGDESLQTLGGHVKDLVVGGTLELFIHRTYQPLKRMADSEVGLPLLNI